MGRCGRAGRTGVAISLCSMDDRPQLAITRRHPDRKMEVCVIVGMEPKKTYVPSENKGKGRGRAWWSASYRRRSRPWSLKRWLRQVVLMGGGQGRGR